MARLLFLGHLEDVAGQEELTLPLPQDTSLADLLAMLPKDLAAALEEPKVKIALNGEIVSPEGLMVSEADELAFLPPVSGG